jgi:gamma-glutamyltranspeptidase/glutathione hydrolase
VFLQQLALLEGFDLEGMGHNSAEYIHTLIECAKLAFADREAYYGDPEFDDVPLDVLLSADYNEARRALVAEEASREMRPGDAARGFPAYATRKVRDDNRAALGIDQPLFRDLSSADPHASDTTHLDTADAEGNMVSATPSGGWLMSSPVIPGLGFPLGTRGQMFYLNPNRPNALAPGKRPRCTLTPSLVTRNGEPVMVFGTPGGDNQDQWTLQFFLNHVEFGMDPQEAIDAPTVHSAHFPSSFYPRNAYPGRLVAEARIGRKVLDALRDRGHGVVTAGPWSNGKVTAIRVDRDRGVISAAASPRGNLAYALAW